MKGQETSETAAQTIFRLIKSALLGFVVLIGVLGLAFAIFLYRNSIPVHNIDLFSVARDTTFYVGVEQNQSRERGKLSIRAVGQVDASTADVLVTYPNGAPVAMKGSLMKGGIDQLWVGDFYDRQAKITFHHKAVQHGHLLLQVHFSYPPTSWGYQQTNRGWVKVK